LKKKTPYKHEILEILNVKYATLSSEDIDI
jgi:hypothetical protein